MMQKKKLWLLVAMLWISSVAGAQVSINMDGSDPDGSAMLDIKSNEKGFLPPRMTQTERDSIDSPAAGLMIFNTTTNQPNYYNGTSWMNFDGTTASSELVPGDLYGGGIVAYVLQPGDPGYEEGVQHGLIAANGDQSPGIQWFNGLYILIGTTGTALGTGAANTNAIVTWQAVGTYAASICSDLVLNGYDDWYLPSKDELDKVYQNKDVIGGFSSSAYYWTSSEYSENFVWVQSFLTGSQSNIGKGNLARVRAIRSF